MHLIFGKKARFQCGAVGNDINLLFFLSLLLLHHSKLRKTSMRELLSEKSPKCTNTMVFDLIFIHPVIGNSNKLKIISVLLSGA